ncbi:hypothetical protein WICPIJ_005190 [Wickerhamomyces pijperi]|uniref:RNA polymerase II-associated protein 1 n=1 Tax=Wickerhamomyces pijperi TaxID=599730 RepID=A0A9P8Q4B4_WICPI|nr:hypothetical protein WICPIJ_005190 [Wickerhamomyces pijperi]
MSKSQDYIAKIRYQNDLPAPLLAPKLLKLQTADEEKVDSPALLTSLSRHEAINNLITIDQDFGMPIDLLRTPTIFSGENYVTANGKLHPKDRVLLRDPNVARSVQNTAQPNVSFLRRTEYIGSMKHSSPGSRPNSSITKSSSSASSKANASLDLATVEKTFEQATKTLRDPSQLRHPNRRSLKAKRVWSLLPDTSRLDQQFATVRFQANTTAEISKPQFETALLREIKVENDTWMGVYTTGGDDLKHVKKELTETDENIPVDDLSETQPRYKYSKVTDFDVKYAKIKGDFEDIALRFDPKSGKVYYNPISGRADLKKRKLVDSHKEEFESKDVGVMKVRIREPTVKELNKRNAMRHAHDSITYELVDDDEDDEEEE